MKKILISILGALALTSCLSEGFVQNDITTADCVIGFGQRAAIYLDVYGNNAPTITCPKDWEYKFVDSLSLLVFKAPEIADTLTLSGTISYVSTDGRNSLSMKIPVFLGYKLNKLTTLKQVICYETADSTAIDITQMEKGVFGAELLDTSYVNKGYFIFQKQVTTLPKGVFDGKKVESIVMPASLATIGNEALAGISTASDEATTIRFNNPIAPVFTNAENENQLAGSRIELIIPKGSKPNYEAAFAPFAAKAASLTITEKH